MYENYAKIRDSKGLTDYQISKDIGISRSVFSDWKVGRHKPSKRTRAKIFEALGLQQADSFFSPDPQDYETTPNDYVIAPTQEFRDRAAAAIRRHSVFSMMSANVAKYDIRLLDGSHVALNPDEYKELQNAVAIFVDTWVKNKNQTDASV